MKRLPLSFLLLLSLTAWSPDSIPGVTTLYSQSFPFEGTCNGHEMVYSWTIGGSGFSETQFIRPWLPFDIVIRGVELVVSTAPQMFWMVGNNADGDAMAFIGKNDLHVMNWFPAGTGFQFPGTQDSDKTDYIDLHGACASGHVDAVLTLYYSKQ